MLVLLAFLTIAAGELLITRHTAAAGGHQARTQTSTDYLAHFCTNYTLPMVVHGCGQDTSTGGNPGPLDPATPMNVIMQCGASETLICATAGNGISDMCCEAVLQEGLSTLCRLLVRVFNGGTFTTTLVTSMLDFYPAVNDDLKRIPRALMTDPTLPVAPPDQVRSLLTSVATLAPITVPFNDRRRNMIDLSFFYCGQSNLAVTFGVSGTTLSAESEVFVCEQAMGATCGNQNNYGTDGVVTVFHSISSRPLSYGRQYFLRLLSYGHENGKPTIDVVVGNTVVPIPPFVLEDHLARY